MSDLFPVLKTERLILRRVVEKDVDKILKIFSDEEVMIYFGMFPITKREEAEVVMKNFRDSFENKLSLRWAITLRVSGEFIGTCGFHNMNLTHRRAEIGYEIDKDFWRKGYVTEAIKKIIEFGFKTCDFNRIEALVYPENVASHKSLLKLDFVKEGYLRKYTIFRNIPQDLVMYSLLRTEYNEK